MRIRCSTCERTFKSERAFEAHTSDCVARLIGTANPTLEQLKAAYEAGQKLKALSRK